MKKGLFKRNIKSSYIQKNLLKLKSRLFSYRCGCLKNLDAHDKEKSKENASIAKWDRETCSVDDGHTDAFGEIVFQGYEDSPAKYIRASYKTDMDTMWLFLQKTWNLKKPKLLISVTGGATKLPIRNRLKETFSKSLVKVATTTSTKL
jgi:hypothetical protein